MSGPAHPGRRRTGRLAAACAVALLAAGTGWWWFGSGDSAGSAVPAGAGAGAAGVAALPPVADAATLEGIVAREPRNARAWALLGFKLAEQARYDEAARAFEQAVAHGPKIASDPAVLCEWADVLGMSQGGSLAGRPTALIAQALALRPGHPQALEMAGSAAYQRGDFVAALRHWEALRPQLASDALRQQQLDAAIERARRRAATALPAG